MNTIKFSRSGILSIFTLLAVYFLTFPAIKAQDVLTSGTTKTITSLVSNDIIVPDVEGTIELTLRGGDGGDAYLKGLTCNKRIKGGSGATIKATFSVGNGAGQLKPGGLLRVFVGMTGKTEQTKCAPSPTGVHGGGGGSSAVLYLDPSESPSSNYSGIWDLLTVAGAGGAGGRYVAGDHRTGYGANGGDEGDDGANHGTTKDGECGSVPSGGGVLCNSMYNSVGNNMIAALENVQGTRVQLKANSEAYKTHGEKNTNHEVDGGDGFTGGGGGEKGPGGGGGFSGGGSDTHAGGGGSFVSAVFTTTNVQRIDGSTGGGTQKNGTVTITYTAQQQ